MRDIYTLKRIRSALVGAGAVFVTEWAWAYPHPLCSASWWVTVPAVILFAPPAAALVDAVFAPRSPAT